MSVDLLAMTRWLLTCPAARQRLALVGFPDADRATLFARADRGRAFATVADLVSAGEVFDIIALDVDAEIGPLGRFLVPGGSICINREKDAVPGFQRGFVYWAQSIGHFTRFLKKGSP